MGGQSILTVQNAVGLDRNDTVIALTPIAQLHI